MAETIKIGGELESIATNNKVADVSNIKDKTQGDKSQAQINDEINTAINNRYTKSETYTKTEINEQISVLTSGNYVTLEAEDGDTLVNIFNGVTGAIDTIYRVAKWDGSVPEYNITVYSEYCYDSTSETFKCLNVKQYGIDDKPTAESNNLVKSGGIYLDEKLLENRINDTIYEINTQVSLNSALNNYIKFDTKLWTSSSAYKHYNIQVNAGEIYKIINNTGHSAYYAFLKSIPPSTVNVGDNVDYCDNTTLNIILENEVKRYIIIPENCVCLYVYAGKSSDLYPYTPTIYSCEDKINSKIDTIINAQINEVINTQINAIKDNTNLHNPSDSAIAMAVDVMPLRVKLDGITVEENKFNFTLGNGYINSAGALIGQTENAHAEITLNDGIKSIRFLGLVVVTSTASSAVKEYSYAFYDNNNGLIEVKKYNRVDSVPSGSTDKHEYVISVPDNAAKFMCSIATINRTSFYCYSQSGKNIIDIISSSSSELKYEDDTTRSNLNWQLYPLGLKLGIYPNIFYNRFNTIAGVQCVWYKAVKKDELIKIECIRENCVMYFSSIIPNDNVEYISSAIQEGITIIRCNADGYISFSSYTLSTYKQASPVRLYSLAPNIDGYIKHIINATLTKQRTIDTVVGSDTYGEVINISNNNFGLSPSIDISKYNYIGIKTYYTTATFAYSGAGSMFFDETYVPGQNDAQSVVGDPIGVVYTITGKSDISFFKVPTGAKYFRAFGYLTNMVIYGLDYEESSIDPDDITEIVDNTIKNFVKEEAATISSKTIFELNPDTEMLEKMVIAKMKYNRGGSYPGTITPLVLAHISDIHGSATRYRRYIDFANHWKSKNYIDELIDTGDLVNSDYSDGLAWRNAIEGVGNILTITGNHDTKCSTTEQTIANLTLYDVWEYHGAVSVDPSKRTDAYNLLLAGKVDNWNVIQPLNAATNGLCYYYKDYASQGIRLIALDVMGYDQDQQDWLEAKLAEALTLTYHVVIIAHFTGTSMTPLVCNYTSLRTIGSIFHPYTSRYLEETNPGAIVESVDTFQENGGNFIGYITGHYHRDMINVVRGYPKQLVFAVSSGGVTTTWDFTKVDGCKSYDSFQIISINTEDKTVKLIKVGSNIDYYMRKKGTVSVGYTLVKDDGTTPDSGETATKVKGILGEGF